MSLSLDRLAAPIFALSIVSIICGSPVQASTFEVLHTFSGAGDGSFPNAGLINVHGTLYGTTSGTVYSMTKGGVLNTIAAPGGILFGGVIDIAGTLYTTTARDGPAQAGTVISVTTQGVLRVLYEFTGGSDGGDPLAGLIHVGGKFYGTTSKGGDDGNGTIFSVTKSGRFQVLHAFTGANGDSGYPWAGLINMNGTFYGTTRNDGVFSITPSGAYNQINPLGGSQSVAALVGVDGTLYGTTLVGGGNSPNCSGFNGCGTVFGVTTAGVEVRGYGFQAGMDGAYPAASLIYVNGALYGTTSAGGGTGCGGHEGCGTVFKLSTKGVETVLYRFSGGADGAQPYANLLSVGDYLYGTTYEGGSHNGGVVFRLKP